MAMFSLISIIAKDFFNQDPECLAINSASLYKKTHVTFSYVHLLVKQKVINNLYFNKSTKNGDMLKFKTHDFTELINTMLMAA